MITGSESLKFVCFFLNFFHVFELEIIFCFEFVDYIYYFFQKVFLCRKVFSLRRSSGKHCGFRCLCGQPCSSACPLRNPVVLCMSSSRSAGPPRVLKFPCLALSCKFSVAALLCPTSFIVHGLCCDCWVCQNHPSHCKFHCSWALSWVLSLSKLHLSGGSRVPWAIFGEPLL